MGNYYADPSGNVIQIEDPSLIEKWLFGSWDRLVAEPVKNFVNSKIYEITTELKYGIPDIAELIAITIIISIALKMFLFPNKGKDGSIIYTTIVAYTILRLFWRVKFNV
jgi:hypothetical protein